MGWISVFHFNCVPQSCVLAIRPDLICVHVMRNNRVRSDYGSARYPYTRNNRHSRSKPNVISQNRTQARTIRPLRTYRPLPCNRMIRHLQ